MITKSCFFSIMIFPVIIFATQARVESMGKSDAFFMDDISIYRNPANINIYPNFLVGELGVYKEDGVDSARESANTIRPTNRDPQSPYYGGIFAYSLNKDKELGSRYPQITLGAVVNKQNELVNTLMGKIAENKKKLFAGDTILENSDQAVLAKMDPVGLRTDFFMGLTTKKGQMFGLHIYSAFQNDYDEGKPDSAYNTSVLKFDAGANVPLGRIADLEVNFGVGMLGFNTPVQKGKASDITLNFDARLFTTLEIINGEIVPIFGYKQIAIDSLSYNYSKVYAGVGANVTLDRGFFWLGIQGVNERIDKGEMNIISIPLSFGIERNIIWD
ncbi:MAG: hypothetical protein ABIA63_07385, partial [bacterium]